MQTKGRPAAICPQNWSWTLVSTGWNPSVSDPGSGNAAQVHLTTCIRWVCRQGTNWKFTHTLAALKEETSHQQSWAGRWGVGLSHWPDTGRWGWSWSNRNEQRWCWALLPVAIESYTVITCCELDSLPVPWTKLTWLQSPEDTLAMPFLVVLDR